MTKRPINAIDYDAILREAHAAAKAAGANLREDPYALDCGFAWVSILGNHPLARHCRKSLANAQARGAKADTRFYGSKGWPTGWDFWCPGNAPVQSMHIHEICAQAFRDVLQQYDINASVSSRYD